MADTKISDLTAVTSLVSTDELVLARAGVSDKIDALYLPGFEITYDEFTANVVISATTEATANTIVTASAFTADGSTRVLVEFHCFTIDGGNAGVAGCLYLDGSSIGQWFFVGSGGSITTQAAVTARRFMTPAAGSRTFSVRAFKASGNGTAKAGAGGSGAVLPGYIRITKA